MILLHINAVMMALLLQLKKFIRFIIIFPLAAVAGFLVFIGTYFAYTYYMAREIWASFDYAKETEAPKSVGESSENILQEQELKEEAGEEVIFH